MSSGEGPSGDRTPEAVGSFDRRIRNLAVFAALAGSLACLAYSAAVGSAISEAAEILGSALIVAAAASACGALMGFLFGIPRTLQREAAPDDATSTRYLANTNLEQISDWLTKILVGITLVQIGSVGPQLSRLAQALSPMLGGSPSSAGFGLALCVYSLLAAFLITYLWTRTGLKRELQLADRDIEAAVRAVVNDQSSADAAAVALVERQLNGQGTPTLQELTDALEKASVFARMQVYQRAEGQRSANWRGDSAAESEPHRRTIPVFRALAAVDRERKYHRNYGSLGFALKDADPPDPLGAVDALTSAIGIRGLAARAGFALYEWNRAVCRIRSDAQFQLDQPSSAEARDQIEADLRIAAQRLGVHLFEPSADDPDVDAVGHWLMLNSLSYDALRATQ
jgi:hypothetical protein